MKNIFLRLQKYPWLYLVFAGLSWLLLDVGFRYAYRDFGATPYYHYIPLIFSLCWCAVFCAVVSLLPRPGKRIFLIVSFILFSFLTLVHAALAGIFHRFFSFSSMMFAGDGAAFLDSSYLQIRWGVFAVIAVCACLMAVAVILAPQERCTKRKIGVSLLAVALALVGGTALVKTSLSEETFMSWDNYARGSAVYENFSNSRAALLLTGLYQYTWRDYYMSSALKGAIDGLGDKERIAALDQYYADKTPDEDNAMTGALAGKNLILIQLEAIDTWMLTAEAMPNLWAVQQQSVDFRNHFAPMYLAAGTFNTENIVNTGLVSPFTGATTDIYSRNSYPLSVANLFRAQGYRAQSFHTTRGEVYDREIIHLNWGYEAYNSSTEMGLAYPERDSDLIRAFDMIVPDEPFLSFIITYSGHGAYLGSEVSALHYEDVAATLPAGTEDMYIHALAHARETDLFIGELMAALKDSGHDKDTAIVFYSDHYNYYVMDDSLVMKYKGVDDEYMMQQTPFFIWADGLEPQSVEKVTSSIDILPTIVNLFDLDSDGRYYVGNDAFSEQGGYVFFADFTWYDGKELRQSDRDEPANEHEAAINAAIQQRLNAGWETMETDYFAQSPSF